jgi:hypothetical protein
MSKRSQQNLYEEAVQLGVKIGNKLVRVKCPRCHQFSTPSRTQFYRQHGADKCEQLQEDMDQLAGVLRRLRRPVCM